MAYRIRYEVQRNKRYWWAIAGVGIAAAALTKPLWYWEFARYVGRMIDGAR